MKSLTFYYLLALFIFKSRGDDNLKIAIVGAGIGGSSCAYFLRELMGDKIEIYVYEADKVGGRLAITEYEGHSYEVGGSVIHNRNKYMNSFRDKFELEEQLDGSNSPFGIYDKNGIAFVTSEYGLLTYTKAILRYGISLWKLDSFIKKMLNEFDRLYEIQEQGESFETVEELLGAADPTFLRYMHITSENGFSRIAGINKVTIDDLIRGSLTINYGQSTKVNFFVGSVSTAGLIGGIWSVEGGNWKVADLLLAKSWIYLIRNKVTKIIFHPDSKTYTVESVSQTTNDVLREFYNIVVLAHPITDDCKNPIEFVNFPSPIRVKGKYHRTVTTILSGELNGNYFGLKEGTKVPEGGIVNNDDSKVINSIGRLTPVTGSTSDERNVWKIFSKKPLTEEELDELFSNRGQPSVVDWLAYPQYNDLGVSGNFILNSRLYYINAIEWAASSMEMSVIGAKNVALLIAKEFSIPVKKVEDTADESKEKKFCTWRTFFCYL